MGLAISYKTGATSRITGDGKGDRCTVTAAVFIIARPAAKLVTSIKVIEKLNLRLRGNSGGTRTRAVDGTGDAGDAATFDWLGHGEGIIGHSYRLKQGAAT
ncbi:MAG: hypothetical protein N0E39_15890 [Candidatus Thiodiazotropha lotti]|nr:hypothetical protein [Candidatus Thiodiazotropha lotti]